MQHRTKTTPTAVASEASDCLPSEATAYPAITVDFIKQFCSGGTSKTISKLAHTINKIINLDPSIQKYVSVVFYHLQDFKIRLVTAEQIKEIAKKVKNNAQYQMGNGGYFIHERSLLIVLDDNGDLSSDCARTIIHELRHAYWHTLQIARVGNADAYVHNYFPLTPAEKEKVKAMDTSGNKRVDRIHKLLKKEKENKLTIKQQEDLRHLRELGKTYGDFYAFTISNTMPKQQFDRYIQGKVNHELNNPEYGLLKVISFKKISDDNYKVVLKSVDPLWSMIWNRELVLKSIKLYNENAHLYELDAHYMEIFNPAYLEIFFKEYFHYSQNLFLSTHFPKQCLPVL